MNCRRIKRNGFQEWLICSLHLTQQADPCGSNPVAEQNGTVFQEFEFRLRFESASCLCFQHCLDNTGRAKQHNVLFTKESLMITLKAEAFQFDELKNGNPVQLRATLPIRQTDQMRKGNYVEIMNNDSRLKAAIISDPLIVVKQTDDGKHREFSVEVSKTSL